MIEEALGSIAVAYGLMWDGRDFETRSWALVVSMNTGEVRTINGALPVGCYVPFNDGMANA